MLNRNRGHGGAGSGDRGGAAKIGGDYEKAVYSGMSESQVDENEARDLGVVYDTVTAWQPYTEPELYQSNVPEANQNIAYQFFRNRFEGVK